MRARLLLVASAALFVCVDAFAQMVPAAPTAPSPPASAAPSPTASAAPSAPAPPSAPPAPSSSVAPAAPSAPPVTAAPPASSSPAPAPAAPAAPATSAPPAAPPPPEAAAPPPRGQGDAFAHHTGPEAAAADWDVKGFLGWEFEVRGGFVLPEAASPVTAPGLLPGGQGAGAPTGDILYGTENPYSYDPFGFSLTAGYRFLPFLSAGIFFDYANFQTNDQTDTGGYSDSTSQLQRQVWQLGAYVRYYLTTLSRRLHPWAEIGVGPTEDTASYTRILAGMGTVTAQTTNYYLTYWGVATELKVGLDWRLSPYFSVGPLLGYSRTFGLSGNVQVCPQSPSESGTCDTTSPNYVQSKSSSPVATSGYGMFFGGIFLKLTLGPSLR